MAGHIISVIGGKGGVGKSVFAANLAFAYAMDRRQKVLLLDFDQRALGDLSLITGIKHRKTLKDLAEFSGSIEPRSLQQFISPPLQNVSFLGMPREQAIADSIEVEALGKTLKALPNIFPLTIIDVGSELTPLAAKALEASTLILLIGSPDVLVINQTRRIYNDLMTMLFPKEMIQMVMNQYQKGHPVTPELMGKQIGKPVFGIIAKDDNACLASLNKSSPVMVMAKSSSYAKSMSEFVGKLVQKNVLASLEKLNKSSIAPLPSSNAEPSPTDRPGKVYSAWIDLKVRIHRGLAEEMDLNDSGDDQDPKAQLILREQTKKMVVQLLQKEETKGVISGREDLNKIVKEIVDEAVGLGPLEDMLADPTVSEIMVNGPFRIYFEQSGKIKKSKVTFSNNHQVTNVVRKIIQPLGRRIDTKVPYVDARLLDGSRVHAIIQPCSIDGTTITIRKFPENRLDYKELIKFGSMTQNMADFLRLAVEAKLNIVVSGGTGSGKTTLINLLAGFIPANERIITVEDSAELSLPQDHVVRLETKPPSLEGEGEVDVRLLVKQTLRMRPDRIVVGECRGGEALDMLQAMNTGHDGSMTTVHSNSPRDCLARLETLVQYAGTGLANKAIKEMIASAVNIIVQQSRLDDGSRKIISIAEVGGMQGDVITLQNVFEFQQTGTDKMGKIQGKFLTAGFIPKFVEKLEKRGYKIPRGIFNNEN